MTNNPILLHAEKYLSLGLCPIPLKPESKEPLIKWEAFQKRLPSPQDLKEWFKSGSENIGLVTGTVSNLAVIDADGPEGMSWVTKVGLFSPVTVLSGNGRHLWFKYAAGLANSAGKIAPKVDIRGEGGYVVAPPSRHECGKRYRFITPNVNFRSLPSFPTHVLSVKPVCSSPIISKPESWISDALEDMKNGHVHNTLISVLGKFRSHNFSIDDTFRLLQPHTLVNGRPFEGLRDKIEEFWDRYPAGKETRLPVGKEPKSIEAFLENEAKTEWLCRPFFAKQSLSFIVGLPESLKSWLTTDLAIELSRGGKWLGAFQTEKSRVLYIDQERALSETQRRFKALLSDKNIPRRSLSGSLFVDCSSHRKVDLDVSYESFRQEIMKIRPDVIIIDSFVTFHQTSENDRMEIQKVLDRLKKIREDFGCSFIFINHESKSAYQDAVDHNEPSAGRMVGSIGVVAAPESVLTVKKISSGTSNVYQTKNSLANSATEFTVNVTDTKDGISVKAVL